MDRRNSLEMLERNVGTDPDMRHTLASDRRVEARRRIDVARRGQDPDAATVAFREAKARAVAEFESAYVRNLLRRAEGNVSLAARLAGKERSRFNRLVRKYRIVARDFKPSSSSESANADVSRVPG